MGNQRSSVPIPIARSRVSAHHGFLHGARYLIHDRDPWFTEAFASVLATSGVQAVKLPARSPELNAYAEQFVRSIKGECLAKVIPIGERHLRVAVKEYTAHYHVERNHQGLNNERIEMSPRQDNSPSAAIRCRERLGGVLKDYRSAA